MKQSSVQRRGSVKTTSRASYHQQVTAPSSTARSNLSSRAKEAEGALQRIKRMISQHTQQNLEEDEKISVLSEQSAREEKFKDQAKEKDHLKLELNFEDKSEAEMFQTPEYYFFMADRELLEDQLNYINAKYEQLEPKYKQAAERLERMEFTEKERDSLISEKYYLLSELKKLSNHNYEGELKSLSKKRSNNLNDSSLIQSPMDPTFQAISYQSGVDLGAPRIVSNSELQKEYASLKKQLENTEQLLAQAKFKNTKLQLQLQEKTDQYNEILKNFKSNEKEVNEKTHVLKHLRLELDRMHAKSSAEIKKLKKQLELANKKAPSSLNVSMVKNSGRAASNDPGNTSMHLTPESKTQTYSTFRSSQGTSARGQAAGVVDKNAVMMQELNTRLESIQSQQGVVKVQRYGGLVNVGPKPETDETQKKGGSAKKGGFFSWMKKS